MKLKGAVFINDTYQDDFWLYELLQVNKIAFKIKVRLNILIQGFEFSVPRLNSVFLKPFEQTFSIANQNISSVWLKKSFKDVFMKWKNWKK